MPITYRSPLELDSELCLLLGTLTARWSMVENALQQFLAIMHDNSDTADAIFHSVGSFRQRIEIVKATAGTIFEWEGDYQNFCRLLANIYAAFQTRNRLIHSSYQAVLTPEGGKIQKWPSFSAGDEDEIKSAKMHYIGYEVHESDPRRVNKGTFLNHMERLDALLCELVHDYMDDLAGLTGDDPSWRDSHLQQRHNKEP